MRLSNRGRAKVFATVSISDLTHHRKLRQSVPHAGTMWVNCDDVFDAAAPFGGFTMNGIGPELGAAALVNDTEPKTVTMSLRKLRSS